MVYIAPGDCHMTFDADHIVLDGGAKEHFTRPAVDPLFVSAAKAYGPRVVAVILTGGGHDGMEGLLLVTTEGGLPPGAEAVAGRTHLDAKVRDRA